MASTEQPQVPPLNGLDQKDVREAASMIRHGKVYDLECGRWPGMPLWHGHPTFQVLVYRTPQGIDNQGDQDWLGTNEVHYRWHSDLVMGTVHSGTHIDALSHVTCGDDNHWFGGAVSGRSTGDFGPLKGDATEIPPIVGRGVLLDVAAAKGVQALEAHYEITAEDLSEALEKQGTELRPNDVVLVRTGYLSVWPDPDGVEAHKEAGINLGAAEMLMGAGAVAVGADTESLENLPSKVEGNPHPVHIAMLIERGVYIIEMAYLEDLSHDQVYEFFFACTPLKIRGATGSMIRPLAIV